MSIADNIRFVEYIPANLEKAANRIRSEERAATEREIMEWLRDKNSIAEWLQRQGRNPDPNDLADAIERGEYRKRP